MYRGTVFRRLEYGVAIVLYFISSQQVSGIVMQMKIE